MTLNRITENNKLKKKWFFDKISVQTRWNVVYGTGIFLCIFLYITYWFLDRISGRGIDDSVIYLMRTGLRGTGVGDFSEIILQGSIFILISAFLSYFLSKRITRAGILLLLIFLTFNPVVRAIIGVNLPEGEITEALQRDFDKFYKEPSIVGNGKAKNLVYIYLESIENIYLNEKIFPELTPNLKQLTKESISFTDIKEVDGSNFTIAGMVASQCGIPLISPSHGNAFEYVDRYLPGIECLGDLLKGAGYHLTFLGGADPVFAGKGNFYITHGFDEVLGREDLKGLLEDREYLSEWGLFDDSTFDIAFEKFDSLSRNSEPFALVVLTLDTHSPHGNPSKSCDGLVYKEGENSILNSVYCTDYLVGRFIDKIRNSEYQDDTLIVVSSDHLSLRGQATPILEKYQRDRRNLFLILDGDESPVSITRLGSTLDMSSTFLPFLGFVGEIGLGRNLLSENYNESEIREIQEKIINWKPIYRTFWDFPKLESSIILGLSEGGATLEFGDRKFLGPVLAVFDEYGNSELIFKYREERMMNIFEDDKVFEDRLKKLQKNEYYLLLDFCTLNGEEWCYEVGQRNKVIQNGELSSGTTPKEIDLLTLFK